MQQIKQRKFQNHTRMALNQLPMTKALMKIISVIIIQPVLLCAEKGIDERQPIGYRQKDFSSDVVKASHTEIRMQRGNFLATINALAKLDAVLMEHLEKGFKSTKMI